MPFDYDKVEALYPEAGNYMIDPMRYWVLPAGKEDKLTELCESGEYFAQEKIDGALYMFVKTENHSYLFSRSKSTVTGLLGEKLDRVPHIQAALDCLPAGTVLVGEIFYPGGTSKTTTTIMGALPAKAIARQKDNPIHYYLFDILYLNGENQMSLPANIRYANLEELYHDYNLSQYPFMHLAPIVRENIPEYLNEILNRGGEGIVIKKNDGEYVEGKRPAWQTIKIKQHDTIDLVCTGTVPPTKIYTGKELDTWEFWETKDGELVNTNAIGKSEEKEIRETGTPVTKYYYFGWHTAIKIGAYDDEGNLVELGTVSSGLSDDMKRLMTEFPGNFVGKVVALDCMSIDHKAKTLRHPAINCFRTDKNAEDCKISEIF